MITNLILAGAQIKGISYVGFLKALQELQLFNGIKNICGVSSGSIVGLCFFLEMSYLSIEKLVFEVVNYENIKNNKNINITDLFELYGIESGNNIIKIIEIILEKKTDNRKCTFRDLQKLYPNKKLIIVGTNLSNNQTEFFSIDNYADMEIAKAIRISISVPLIFTRIKHKEDIYVDGGVSCNFPMDYFKNDMEHTLGVCVSSLNYISEITSIDTYLSRVIRILIDSNDKYIKERYNKNIIEIVVDYDYADINLGVQKRKYLLDCGYDQTLMNIKNKIFYKYFQIKKIINNIITKIEKKNIT